MEGDGVVLKIMLACIIMMIVFLVWAVFALANKLDGVDHDVRWLERRVAGLECDDDDDDDEPDSDKPSGRTRQRAGHADPAGRV